MSTLRPFSVIIISSLLVLGGEVGLHPAWSQAIYNTPHVSIRCDNPADLLEMERSLHCRPVENSPQNPAISPASAGPVLLPQLTARVEGLLTNVCRIINVQLKDSARMQIYLLANGEQVRERQLLFQPSARAVKLPIFGYGALEGFYEPQSRTIFLSLADLTAGVLAHEMAHFVLCQAYAPAPSHNLQEGWARYVEYQLR